MPLYWHAILFSKTKLTKKWVIESEEMLAKGGLKTIYFSPEIIYYNNDNGMLKISL